MKADVVVDIGNSRIKWGLCSGERVEKIVSLPPDHESAWNEQAKSWQLPAHCKWALAGVQPARLRRFKMWILQRRDLVRELNSWNELPVQVGIENPESVGLDRLLNAVAANDRVKRKVPVLIVDAGSAVTVDAVDETSVFQGGVIFPGCRLMAKALHDYTASLPLVEIDWTNPPLPGNSTSGAIKAGVFWAVAGGVKAVLRQMAGRFRSSVKSHLEQNISPDPVVFLTGGDGALLAPVMDSHVQYWPEMTLEGIRVAAEALP
jgi:type III pantothenate kinase